MIASSTICSHCGAFLGMLNRHTCNGRVIIRTYRPELIGYYYASDVFYTARPMEKMKKNNPYARTYHKGDKINQRGGVSALCFKRPRSISSNVRWTTDDKAVTCKKCLAIMSTERGKGECE